MLIGGGIGAGIALLWAPKSGRELRSGIADLVNKGCAATVETAAEVRDRTTEYFETVKETGGKGLGAIASGLSAAREEFRSTFTR